LDVNAGEVDFEVVGAGADADADEGVDEEARVGLGVEEAVVEVEVVVFGMTGAFWTGNELEVEVDIEVEVAGTGTGMVTCPSSAFPVDVATGLTTELEDPGSTDIDVVFTAHSFLFLIILLPLLLA